MSSFVDALGGTFSSDGFVPRRVCGLWPDWLVWEHVVGNALVWLAYIAVPLMIWRLGVRRAQWAPFKGVARAFALFIGLCGLGHFLDMLAFVQPLYRLSGHVLVVTGLVSCWTAWSIRRAWPALEAMKSPDELERVIAERTAALNRAIDDLKHAELDRAYLAAIVESSDDPIIGKDLDGLITSWNAGAERLFGYSAAEAVGRPITFLMPLDRLAEERTIMERLKRGERIHHFESVRLSKDGRSIDVSLTISAIKDRSGRIVGISKIARDITERKQAEERIKASERIYRAIGESIPFGIWTCDPEGRNTYVSESCLRLVGMTQEQCSEFGWADVLHPDDAERTIAAWKECVRVEGTWDNEYRFRGTDGDWHPILSRGVPIRGDDGRIVHWAGINLDISRLKRAEAQIRLLNESLEQRVQERTAKLAMAYESLREGTEALRRSEAALRESQRQAGLGSWQWDLVTDIVTWSDELYRIAGRDPSRRPPSFGERAELFTPESLTRHDAVLMAALEIGKSYEIELEMTSGDGANRWIIGRGEAVRSDDGRIVMLRGTAQDVTARKQFEEELRRARDDAMAATRAKSEFLANMSHEIRTPMNGVLGMTELLLDTPLNDLQRDFAETIRASGEALLTVINDILDFSKIEAGKLTLESTEFDLRTLMEEVVDLLSSSAQQKNLGILCRVAREVPCRLVGDPVRIRQVLTNLAGNAVKFTERGEVNLEARLVAENGDKVTLRILVRDSGIGIPADRHADIFESFTQVEGGNSRLHGGTGLGLAICRSLVALMGGRIGLESRPGSGSTFWFEVAFGKGCGDSGIVAAQLRGLRVLVVGAREATRAILRETLLSWACRPEVAASGAEALTKLLANSEGDPFGLILLDQDMAGMSGEQAARAIKGDPRFAKVPLVRLTSLDPPGDAEEIEDGLWAARLTKPIRRSHLYNTLRRAIAAPESVRARSPAAETDGMKLASPLRILLAEDNEINRRVAIGIAERLGCVVEAVCNGQEAVAALDYGRHDVVLMDVQMPEMDGFAATAAIRERERANGRHIPIIAMTAHAMQGDRERCLSAGMDGYMSKPIRPGPLREILRDWGARDERPPTAAECRPQTEFRSFSPAIAGESCGNDPKLIREVLELVLTSVPMRLERLRTAVAEGGGRQVSWEAHSLKGTFVTIGAEALAAACQNVMSLGERDDIATIREAYPPIRNQWETLEEEVSRYVRSLTGNEPARIP